VRLNNRRSVALAALTVFTLVAAACSGDDDDSSSAGSVSGATTATTEAPATTTGSTEGTTATTTAGTDGTATTTPSSGSTAGTAGSDSGLPKASERQLPPGEKHVEKDEGKPVQGGTLVYGIEADTANGWAPYKTSFATAGYVLLASVSDPLFGATADGDIAGVLVDKWEPNADSTEWKLHVREGIKFQDGTPLDGEAVAFNINTCKYSALTGAAYTPLESVTGSGQDVTIKSAGGPWVALPRAFTERQCAYMMSPTWLKTLPDITQRDPKSPVYDAALAATPADGDAQKPVGLGAFKFDSYTPGNGNSFKLSRNPDYWRGPKGITGENLPYLDAVEGVAAVDIDSRANSLRSGQFDIIHTSNGDSIKEFEQDDQFETIATALYGDTGYIMLNVADGDTDPQGANAKSPLLNVHCRRALALATDVPRVIEERDAGLTLPATGPFGPGVLGYLKDSGYPTYDPDKANTEFDQCLSDLGTQDIEFTFSTTNDPFNVETNTLIISMWNDVLGGRVKAKITPIEQGQYIGLALTGTFNAFGWRNHGGIDPDTQRYWWKSTSSAPIGSLALNFGRFKDPNMDKALDTVHTSSDPAARKTAAEDVNKIFGEQVYNIWLSWALWGVIEQPYVNGLEADVLPDGTQGIGLAFSGRHQMNQIWCDNGKCE
jgi:peptide/nickel transport system substrate-binding protein